MGSRTHINSLCSDDDEGALEEEEQAKRRMPVLKTRSDFFVSIF